MHDLLPNPKNRPKQSLMHQIRLLQFIFYWWNLFIYLYTSLKQHIDFYLQFQLSVAQISINSKNRNIHNALCKSGYWSWQRLNCFPTHNFSIHCFLFGKRPRRGRWPMLSYIWGIFSFSFFSFSVPPNPNPTLRPKSQPQGPNPILEAQIPFLRPKSHLWGPNPSLKA